MSAGAALLARADAADTRGAPDLDLLFRPRAIAVVGATETAGAVGSQVMENLIHHGFAGTLYPINPKYQTLHGRACYPDIASLPETPALVAIAVPAAHVAQVIEAAGKKGIAFAVVFASGFAETGAEGLALQDALAATARRAGVRIIGPNCQGVMNIADKIHVGFGPPYRLTYKAGSVGLISQSGAFGNSLVMGMSDEGIGLRRYASTGNEADTSALDLMEAMLDDPEVSVIAGYIEGFRDAVRLRAIAARAAERQVPLVLWKVGNSKAGAHAAASHTANLSGDHRLYKAAFDQLGIVSVFDVGDMADCVRALAPKRRAQGPRIGVVTISGGAGVAMADRAEELGLAIAPFADETLAQLRGRLPAFASVANPLDVTAGALTDPESVLCAMELVARDPNVDMLAVALAATSGAAALTVATALAGLVERISIPVVVAWNAPRADNEAAYAILAGAQIPVFATPGRAIRGLSAVHRFGSAAPAGLARLQVPLAGASFETRTLDEKASKAEIAGTGILAPKEAVAATADATVDAARALGFPVVLKLLSDTIVHKSDIGGVRLNLRSDEVVREAFFAIEAAGRQADPDGPQVRVLVQEQVSGGVEVILGARVDPVFGPMVMVGAGGVLAEILEDVALRLAPIDEEEARRMIAETKVAHILRGVRGQAPSDVDALAAAICGLSQKIASGGALKEVEINPLFVRPEGQGVIAGDCVARVAAG